MKPLTARLLLLLAAPALLAACAGSTITRQSDVDKQGHAGESSSTTTRIFTNKDEAALDRARQDRRLGHYADATAGFQAVYDNTTAKPEFREQALFELARVQADLLNPAKDPENAEDLFARFLSEYPSSPLVDQAREQLAALRVARP